MAYQDITIGTENGGAGDTPFVAWTKAKAMFTELYTLTAVSVTGATSLTSSALGKVHLCSGTSADYTVDLPTAVGNEGVIIFKGINALTKVVTIAGSGGELIDGESSRKISTDGMLSLMSDGSNWVVVNEVGSWIPYTPVLGGFSADPSFTRTDFWRVGKLCTVRIINNASGTSNATTKTITGPFNAAEVSHGFASVVLNAGTIQTTPGVVRTRLASATMDIYRNNDLGTTAWTNSGNCVYALYITYRIA